MTNRELNYFSEGYILGRKKSGGANIQPLTVTENKEYNAADYGCDGFNPVTGNVPSAAVVESITITANGTYTAPSGIDGYNPVIVSVSDPRIDDIKKYIKDFPSDTADAIGTITGTFSGCSEVGENHSYYYTAMYTQFSEDKQFGGLDDAYLVEVKIYQDGKLFNTIGTRIPARSSQDNLYSAGMDNFAKNFYWEKSDDGNSIRFNYHYFSIGSWGSYNLFRNTGWYTL